MIYESMLYRTCIWQHPSKKTEVLVLLSVFSASSPFSSTSWPRVALPVPLQMLCLWAILIPLEARFCIQQTTVSSLLFPQLLLAWDTFFQTKRLPKNHRLSTKKLQVHAWQRISGNDRTCASSWTSVLAFLERHIWDLSFPRHLQNIWDLQIRQMQKLSDLWQQSAPMLPQTESGASGLDTLPMDQASFAGILALCTGDVNGTSVGNGPQLCYWFWCTKTFNCHWSIVHTMLPNEQFRACI